MKTKMYNADVDIMKENILNTGSIVIECCYYRNYMDMNISIDLQKSQEVDNLNYLLNKIRDFKNNNKVDSKIIISEFSHISLYNILYIMCQWFSEQEDIELDPYQNKIPTYLIYEMLNKYMNTLNCRILSKRIIWIMKGI